MKVLIADDESEARQLIYYYLSKEAQSFIISESADGIDTLKLLDNFKPDILFLDIKMPELNGIEVLRQKEKSNLPVVIFTTASEDYALSAFDFDAVDYLFKPFGAERFQKALYKAIAHLNLVQKESNYKNGITIKQGSRSFLLPVKEILYFNAEGNYVEVITETKKYLLKNALYEIELLLDPADFIRVHRSVIINIHAVIQADSLLNGDYIFTLKEGKKIRASRSYRNKFKSVLGLK